MADPTLVGARLPDVHVRQADGEHTVPLRTHTRDATVLVLLPTEAEPLRVYIRTLRDSAEEMRRWDGRLLIIAPEDDVHRRLRLDPEAVAVVIADRFGQIYYAAQARLAAHEGSDDTAERALPGPAEIVEWLKYMTTQCPECGVPDQPGYGAWAPNGF